MRERDFPVRDRPQGVDVSDTPAGAHSSAVIYFLEETAKANGLKPYTCLRRVLRDVPAVKTADEGEALLPWNLHAADLTIDAVA